MFLRDKIDILLNYKNKLGLRHLGAYYRLFFYRKEFEVKKNNGDLKDKVFYVIRVRHNDAGVMAYARWVTYKCNEAYERKMIPVVDMRDGLNTYIDKTEIGKINIWECYFKQPGGYTLEDIKNASCVIYSSLDFNSYAPPYSNLIKNTAKKYISFSDKIDKAADDFIKRYRGDDKKIVGLKFRGTDYTMLQPHSHSKQPTPDQLADFIKEALLKNESNPDYFFLATEDELIIDILKREFRNKIILTDIPRLSHYDRWEKTEYFLSDKIKMGEDYALDIAILGKCDALICSGSQGTWLSVALNEDKYSYIEMIDLGEYE